jgi:hypothetical protein
MSDPNLGQVKQEKIVLYGGRHPAVPQPQVQGLSAESVRRVTMELRANRPLP